MIVKKITVGFVIQTYDTDKQEFTGQEFIAGDEVTVEDQNGDELDSDCCSAYLPFDMVQPDRTDNAAKPSTATT